MIIFAAQKIHEAEVHIAAIDRELADIDAVLPHAGGPDRCQVWDVRSTVDAGPDTHLACPAAARAMASALAFSYQYARAREANQSRRGIACSRSPPRKPDARKRQELARVIERLRS